MSGDTPSLTVLGSASGMPHPERNGSGYVLQAGESLTLFDAGPGTASAFVRFGFDPFKLDQIFISHTHADHVADLPTFVQMLHGLSVRRPLRVHVPGEFAEPLQRYLTALYLIKERLRVGLSVIGYRQGLVCDDRIRVEAHTTSHQTRLTDEFRRLGYDHTMNCFGFNVEVDGRRMFYSGDIGSVSDLHGNLTDPGLAIVEALHVDLDELLDFAAESKAQRFLLTHFGDDKSTSHIEDKVGARKLVHVALAQDGQKWNL